MQHLQLREYSSEHSNILEVRIGKARNRYALKTLVGHVSKLLSQVVSSGYQALILSSDHPEFLPLSDLNQAIDTDSLLALVQQLLALPIPVVSALEHNALDSAWLVALCADATIYATSGEFRYNILVNLR